MSQKQSITLHAPINLSLVVCRQNTLREQQMNLERFNNRVEVGGVAQPRVFNGEPVWQRASNTFGDFVAKAKTTWRIYGTKAQRKAHKKSLTMNRDRVKQEMIHLGAAKILGLCSSHIYASKPQ